MPLLLSNVLKFSMSCVTISYRDRVMTSPCRSLRATLAQDKLRGSTRGDPIFYFATFLHLLRPLMLAKDALAGSTPTRSHLFFFLLYNYSLTFCIQFECTYGQLFRSVLLHHFLSTHLQTSLWRINSPALCLLLW